MIRLLLVDDHALLRAGLAALLDGAEGITVVGQAADGVQALAAAVELTPDVVLMDLSMPVMDGVAATRELLARHPGIAVVVLTSFSERARVRDAVDAGAVGYLLKDSDPADLVAGVRAAARGEAPLDPRVAGALLPGGDPGQRRVRLSPREREVLALVGRGMANKQIARALGITERTVKVHLTSVFRHLGVSDRTSAAIWARDNLLP
ncbi:MAG TPA: response regulator transcription factor [Kineosporiaceae bacterium]|nr:response regulator transcription factor [Kineosporiaceae bacterium]